jgi:HPt (histidine-containing phosphotransfer) domain-containing protein
MGVEFISELIDTYILETYALIEQLRQALAANDAVSFARLVHAIKSSSASLGAIEYSQKARELERLGRANDISGAGPMLDKLAVGFLQVKRCLEEMKNEP